VFEDRTVSWDLKLTIVLVAGKGSQESRGYATPDHVKIILSKGYRVELWSWRSSLSGKFEEIQNQYRQQMSIQYLDDYREFITYIKKKN